MTISFRSSINSLRIQRSLAQSEAALKTTFERLSSGQRINRAADDAAGLSVASRLNSDARVYGQGIRNINDGISALNIAEGTLTQLSSIGIRLKELATQAANGSFSLVQRRSMDTEAFALTNEYNRLTQSTRFNGLGLLNGSLSHFSIQAGYGTDGQVGFGLGQNLRRGIGTGGFGTSALAMNFDLDGYTFSVSADFNGDGKMDVFAHDEDNRNYQVALGNGNGSFSTSAALFGSTPASIGSGIATDLNGDGRQDLVVGSSATGSGEMYVLLGNGNGTFQPIQQIATGVLNDAVSITAGDVNGDGKIDLVAANHNASGTINVLLGNGNGTFGAKTTYSSTSSATSVALGDINGDGTLDIVSSGTELSYRLGNGNGTFGAKILLATGVSSNESRVSVVDLNHDGHLDVAVGGRNLVSTFLGNGNATFSAVRTYLGTGNGPTAFNVGDINGDGYLDMILGGNSVMNTYINRGDGTFGVGVTNSVSGIGYSFGDFNGDGAVDVASLTGTTNGQLNMTFGNSAVTTDVGRLNLLSQANALSALSTIDTILQKINSELGAIGSNQSRLQIALNNLNEGRDRFLEAHGRIVNADIAQESASLVKNQILQQVSSSLLAQANQLPEIALRILRSS